MISKHDLEILIAKVPKHFRSTKGLKEYFKPCSSCYPFVCLLP